MHTIYSYFLKCNVGIGFFMCLLISTFFFFTFKLPLISINRSLKALKIQFPNLFQPIYDFYKEVNVLLLCVNAPVESY